MRIICKISIKIVKNFQVQYVDGGVGKCVTIVGMVHGSTPKLEFLLEKLANHASPPPLHFHMPLLKIVVSAYSHQNYAVQIRHYFSC